MKTFMYIITLICTFNLLLMAFIVWKFGKEVLFDDSDKDKVE